jgi:predicted small lipoprotein YifL
MIAAALLTVLLAACGQTGPLYLPKDDPNATATPQPPTAEEQTDDTETVAPDAAAPAENETP